MLARSGHGFSEPPRPLHPPRGIWQPHALTRRAMTSLASSASASTMGREPYSQAAQLRAGPSTDRQPPLDTVFAPPPPPHLAAYPPAAPQFAPGPAPQQYYACPYPTHPGGYAPPQFAPMAAQMTYAPAPPSSASYDELMASAMTLQPQGSSEAPLRQPEPHAWWQMAPAHAHAVAAPREQWLAGAGAGAAAYAPSAQGMLDHAQAAPLGVAAAGRQCSARSSFDMPRDCSRLLTSGHGGKVGPSASSGAGNAAMMSDADGLLMPHGLARPMQHGFELSSARLPCAGSIDLGGYDMRRSFDDRAPGDADGMTAALDEFIEASAGDFDECVPDCLHSIGGCPCAGCANPVSCTAFARSSAECVHHRSVRRLGPLRIYCQLQPRLRSCRWIRVPDVGSVRCSSMIQGVTASMVRVGSRIAEWYHELEQGA